MRRVPQVDLMPVYIMHKTNKNRIKNQRSHNVELKIKTWMEPLTRYQLLTSTLIIQE